MSGGNECYSQIVKCMKLSEELVVILHFKKRFIFKWRKICHGLHFCLSRTGMRVENLKI